MFWDKGVKEIPELAGRFLVVEKKRDPDWVWKLKAVVRPNAKGGKIFDVRVFTDAACSGIKIKDYTSLDSHPEVILYEGWFDKATNRAELQEGLA